MLTGATQADGDGEAGGGAVPALDRASAGGDGGAGDGQAQAHAAGVAGARRGEAVERLEYALEAGRGNAGTGVDHGDVDTVAAPGHSAHHDRSRRCRVAHRV